MHEPACSVLGLRHLQNHTTLKLTQWSIILSDCLRHLQNHTTLKLTQWSIILSDCLRHLQNHTTLKLRRLTKAQV